MAGTEVKGTNFLTFLKTLERMHGNDARVGTLERVEGEAGELLRAGALLSSGWYPASWYAALHAAAQRATGLGDELSYEVAREGVKEDFRGIYRILTFVLTPQSLLRRAPRVFRTYFRGGGMEVEAGEGSAAVELRCEGFGETLWRDLEGGCVGVLEACGAQDVKCVREAGGGDGDDHLRLAFRWR